MGSRLSITGGHSRRGEEWRFHRDQAKIEQAQVERQLASARLRKEIALADLRNHEKQTEHARSIEEMLRTKFTGEDLYGWMEGELRALYFQCYQSAYKLAKRAERCCQYQLGTDATFVKYGAWDSSVRGLLAGERLYQQLKQMERAYVEQEIREFEISKDVSVAALDPVALIALKESGSCEVDIPEWLFDVDYPGHYFRRLKTVSLSIPAVVSSPISLGATLTLLSSKVRESSRVAGTYAADANFTPDHLPVEAIAASTGQNDTGRFQLDFRDDKYLPFEGAGAISRWRIELPKKIRSFDYDSISNCVLHLKYTSRRDETLAKPALDALQDKLDAIDSGVLFAFFSLRHDFPNEWQSLQTARAATFTVSKDKFPLLAQQGAITVTDLHAALILREEQRTVTYAGTLTPGSGNPIDLRWPGGLGRYRTDADAATIPISPVPKVNAWRLALTQPTLPADLAGVRDLLIAVRYSVKM